MCIKKNALIVMMVISALLMAACGLTITADKPPQEQVSPLPEDENSAMSQTAPNEENISAFPYPAGVCSMEENSESIACCDKTGQPLAVFPVPGMGNPDPRRLHIAGPLSPGSSMPPIIYHSWQPEQGLVISENGTSSTIRNTSAIAGLAGAPGQPAAAFSEVTYEDDIPHSYMYAGTPQELSGAASFYDLEETLNAMVLLPVAVDAESGQAQKIWYTHTAWGIGGADLIYPINRGLYVFDLVSRQNKQALDYQENFQGLSPDRTMAGSISFDFNGDHALRVANLKNGSTIQYPLHATSDRGAGYAVFSPDSRHAAWLEASGSMIENPPAFQTRVRVGETDAPAVVAEIDSTAAAQALGWEVVSFMKPAGWLDDKTVLVEMRGSDWGSAALVKFDITSGSIGMLCPGSFVGFTYP